MMLLCVERGVSCTLIKCVLLPGSFAFSSSIGNAVTCIDRTKQAVWRGIFALIYKILLSESGDLSTIDDIKFGSSVETFLFDIEDGVWSEVV